MILLCIYIVTYLQYPCSTSSKCFLYKVEKIQRQAIKNIG